MTNAHDFNTGYDQWRLDLLPAHMQREVYEYLAHGAEPCNFLHAVLRNDLTDSFSYADHINKSCMEAWVIWLYNYCPGGAWGDHLAVSDWMAEHRDGGNND